MQEEKSGWDKISEQSKAGVEKQRKKERIENGLDIANGGLMIISIICIIIIAAVIYALYGVNVLE